MQFDLQLTKSDNFVGPMGWGTVLQNNNFFLVVYKESEGFVDRSDLSIEDYFTKTSELPFRTLGQDIKLALSNYAGDLLTKFEKHGDKLNVCVLTLIDNNLCAVVKGKLEINLTRGGKTVKLISNALDKTCVEGKILEGDKILASATHKAQPFLMFEIGKAVQTVQSGFVIHKGDFSGTVDDTVIEPKRKDTLNNLKNIIKNLWETNYFVKGEEYEKSAPRRKTAALVGILLLIILGVSIWFGVNSKKQEDFKNSYRSELIEARHNLDESLNIFSLNKARSRELFYQSRVVVENLSKKNIVDPELVVLQQDIESNQGKILGEYKVPTETFVDMGLLTDNFDGEKIVFSSGDVYVVDRGSRKVIKLSLSTKRSEVIVGPNKIDEIYDATAYVGRFFVFNSDGVFEVSEARQKVLDQEVENNILVNAFAGNLYMLDKGDSRIYRFAGDGKVFGPGKDWLSESVDINLSSATSMAIDGSVWILLEGGNVYRFVQGNLQNFSFDTGFVGDVKVDNIFASDESTGLYVLDKTQGKIFVYTKSGEYVAQYVGDALKETSAMIVSEGEKKIILLNGNKLLSMELKHL